MNRYKYSDHILLMMKSILFELKFANPNVGFRKDTLLRRMNLKRNAQHRNYQLERALRVLQHHGKIKPHRYAPKQEAYWRLCS